MKCLRWLPVLCLVLLTGCPKSKIHQERTFTMESGDSNELQIDAPTGSQKIEVKVTSSECPIDAYVLLEEALAGKTGEIDVTKLPETAILDKIKNTKEATLKATIPSKKAYRIYLNNATRTTTVTLKLDSV